MVDSFNVGIQAGSGCEGRKIEHDTFVLSHCDFDIISNFDFNVVLLFQVSTTNVQ